MLIEVHDIPAIQRPTGDEAKERLLRFNLGVQGSPLRLRAEQYLNVDAARPQMGFGLLAEWQREFRMEWARTWDPEGLRRVAPPPRVSEPRQPMFSSGMCW